MSATDVAKQINFWQSWLDGEQKIVTYPDPILTSKSKPVLVTGREFDLVCQRMFEIMYAAKGVGLAAPQVGIPYRFFILNTTGKAENKDKELIFVNPIINYNTVRWNTNMEGCLSIPGLIGKVTRPRTIMIQYHDPNWTAITSQYEGLYARAVEHEVDHLNGMLFFERMGKEERKTVQVDRLLQLLSQQKKENCTDADNK